MPGAVGLILLAAGIILALYVLAGGHLPWESQGVPEKMKRGA